MGLRLRGVLVCALAATITTVPSGQSAGTDDAAATYRQLVQGYRDLDADTMRRLAALPRPTIVTTIDDLLSAPEGARWALDDLKAAAMLHTDTGIELMKAGHLDHGVFHINAANRLIDRTLDAAPAYASYGRRWYALASAMLHAYGAPAWAEELRKRARDRAASSPAGRAMAEALQEELEAAKERPHSRLGYVGLVAGLDARMARRYASVAQMFEKAVCEDPERFDAWLHLGRTRMVAGDDSGAVAAFERSLGTPDPRHRYLAVLFLGAVAERQARLEEAEGRYREAGSIYPWGQSAPLALSQLLSRTARETEARDVLARHQAKARGIVVDPLWTYLLGTDEHLAATLNELRAEVWR